MSHWSYDCNALFDPILVSFPSESVWFHMCSVCSYNTLTHPNITSKDMSDNYGCLSSVSLSMGRWIGLPLTITLWSSRHRWLAHSEPCGSLWHRHSSEPFVLFGLTGIDPAPLLVLLHDAAFQQGPVSTCSDRCGDKKTPNQSHYLPFRCFLNITSGETRQPVDSAPL